MTAPATTAEATSVTPAVAPKQEPVSPPPAALSPLERAVAAWDSVKKASEERAREAPPVAPAVVAKEANEAVVPTKPPEAMPATAPPAAKPPEEPLSTKFAAVAKLERQARESIKAAKASEAKVNAALAAMQSKLDAYEQARANAKLNPVAWLEQGGITYEDATQFQLNGLKATPELQARTARDEIAQFKKEQAEAQQRSAREQQEAEKAQHAQQYEAWRASVVDFVKRDAVQYELIHQQGAFEQVPAVIQQAFNDSQKVLTEAEAADLVERYLEEQIEKAIQSKKWQERIKTAQPTVAAQPRTTTLNNALTSSAVSQNGVPRDNSWEAKKERALLAMSKT